MRFFNVVGRALFVAMLPVPAAGDVRLPAVIGEYMVLQRETHVPIWGTAEPGEAVSVRFRGQTKTATAGEDGRWAVKLDPLAAGGPDVLAVNERKIEDVLVGEVWLGSGQSNMAMAVKDYVATNPPLAALAGRAYPRVRLMSGQWQAATPEANGGFSALMLSFGVPLQEALDVPVGLIVGAASGTPSSRWLTTEMLLADPAAKAQVDAYAAAHPLEGRAEKYAKELAAWEAAAAAAKAAGKPLPPKPFPPAQPGQTIGGTTGDLYQALVRPFVPFAIRGVLWDQGESGTALEDADQFATTGALIRGWRGAWGQEKLPFLYMQKPSGWGSAWDHDDPVTSLAERLTPPPAKPPGLGEGLVREESVRLMRHPATYMVTTADLGAGGHPTNKWGYGRRAARVALGAVYGRALEIYGPLYQSHELKDAAIRVNFTHAGQGLAYRNAERLQGFAIAGEDKVFHWADAVIDGNAVILTSPQVPRPVAVRYNWGSAGAWANLFNKDGLPAPAFRTDKW